MTPSGETPAQRLRELIQEVQDRPPENLELWRERVRAELAHHYGDPDHSEVKRFMSALRPGVVHSAETVESGLFAAEEDRGLRRGVAILIALAERLEADQMADQSPATSSSNRTETMTGEKGGDPSVVWVVHGRNLAARDGMFAFLRALGLRPLEWNQAVGLTDKGSPYIGEVLDRAFETAWTVVVLITPDEIAYLRPEYATSDDDPDLQPAPQARPNVLFEAGIALGHHAERAVLVELGVVRAFSDIAGRHVIRLDGGPESRKVLAQRLQDAGAAVDMTGTDWLSAGDLLQPPSPGGGLPLGRRIPASAQTRSIRLDARYHDRGSGGGRLEIINRGTLAIRDLDIEIPEEAGPSFSVLSDELPISVLPPGKSVFLLASRSMGPGSDHFMIKITGVTEDGEPVSDDAFVSLLG